LTAADIGRVAEPRRAVPERVVDDVSVGDMGALGRATSDRAALLPVVSGGAIFNRALAVVAYSTVTDRVPLPTTT